MRRICSGFAFAILLISATYSAPSLGNWLNSLGNGFCAVVVGVHALRLKGMAPIDYRYSVLSLMRREPHTQEQIGKLFLQVLNYPPNLAHFKSYIRQFPFYLRGMASYAIARADYFDLMIRLMEDDLITWDEKTNTYRRSEEGENFLIRLSKLYADLRKDIDPNLALGDKPNKLGVPIGHDGAVLGFIWKLKRQGMEVNFERLKQVLEEHRYLNAAENLEATLKQQLDLGFITLTSTGYDYTIAGQKELATIFALYHPHNAPYSRAMRQWIERIIIRD